MTSPDMHLDTGALALGALPPEELAAAQEHVRTCDSCREELAGFLETVARLSVVAAQAPPASLRASVLAAVAVTPQLPPLGPSVVGTTEPPATGAAGEPVEPPVGRHRAGAADADGDSSAGADAGGPPADHDNVRQFRPWFRRPATLIAAAVAAVVIGGGAVAIATFAGRDQQVAQTPEQCVAAATDRTQSPPQDGQGQVSYSASCAAVTVDVSGLPELPAGRTYQLWAVSDQPDAAPRSLGLLPQAAQGQQQVVTEPTRPGEVAVAITAEPASGSTAPTSPIVWTAALPA